MAANKLERMREIYGEFPDQLREVLSTIRIFDHSDLTKVPRDHKRHLVKEYNNLKKQKKELYSTIMISLKGSDRGVCKKQYSSFCYEAEVLALDLENCDILISTAKDEIKKIKGEYDEYNRTLRKESNRKLNQLRSKVLVYCIARDKIKFLYDAVSGSTKYGLQAVKIRKIYEKKQRPAIKKIDNKIAKLSKVLNDLSA